MDRDLRSIDPEIYEAIERETERENDNILLIASENYASRAVLEAQGSVFTNKYAEGYPGRRYYGGCEHADTIETLAVQRAKRLFGAEHVNVQPHSGTQANMAVYFAFLKPADRIMGMSLSHGGHLSHGAQVNFSGFLYEHISYGVNSEGFIDMQEVRTIALKHRPKMIVAGASAYSRTLDFKAFADVAREAGAYLMADIAHIAGLVAAGVHPSPFPHADFVTTTTHKTLRGPRGGMIMCRADYGRAVDRMIFPGIQGGPLVHVMAAKAVAFKEALKDEFKGYQEAVVNNAQALAGGLVKKGFNIISGGTDNHLMLIDLTNKGVTGKDAEAALEKAGITVNKNTIPYDNLSPAVTSGIRIGTPSVTTRGMREAEMAEVADMIDRVFLSMDDEAVLDGINRQARALCARFPPLRIMKCPYCGHRDDKVIDSRSSRDGDVIRRRRECVECLRRYTSYERVEADILPMLIKKDGRREPFDREKVLAGLKKACEKRPIPVETYDKVAESIEKKLLSLGAKEVHSSMVGEEVMEHLKELDKVAYVRFASVYREFKDVREFMEEVKTLSPRGRGTKG